MNRIQSLKNRKLGVNWNWIVCLLLLLPTIAGFGNEYVHIKVHVPKEQAPIIVEEHPPHKVIHHFHHHPRARHRGPPPKPKPNPVLESVILSDLDKPNHLSEHADYLNHAKELAEHLSETYVIKKAPPPRPPPKQRINTYTVIEEKHRPHYEEADEPVDTYRVIDQRPTHHKSHHSHGYPHHSDPGGDRDEFEDYGSEHSGGDGASGYHYPAPASQYHRSNSYAEPAPVEEVAEPEYDYPPSGADAGGFAPYARSPRPHPAHTLEAPEQAAVSQYGYGKSSFRPSPQIHAPAELDDYAAPQVRRRSRPGLGADSVDWPRRSAVDSYSAGHVQGLGSGGYQYAGPYAS